MREWTYLTLEQVLVIHQDQIDKYGGSHGISDLNLLESAIFRPQTTFSNSDIYPSIFDKATAVFQSLIKNHPFVDGNKRTAIVCLVIFLNLNGYEFKINPDKLVDDVIKIETENWSKSKINTWISSHSDKK
jgi:death-on-curing protein